MSIRYRVYALAAPLALTLAARTAQAYQQERSDHGARVHFAEMPARVALGAPVPGVPDGGASAIRRAMASWESPACTGLQFAELTGPGGGAGASFEIRYIASGWVHGATLAAHTTVKSDPRTGIILEAVIELNGAYRFTTGEPVAAGALDLESVVLHELGHFIGLAHSPHGRSVMRAGIKPGAPPQRELFDDDIAGVCAAYPLVRAHSAPRARPTARGGPPHSSVWMTALASGALLAMAVAGGIAMRRARAR